MLIAAGKGTERKARKEMLQKTNESLENKLNIEFIKRRLKIILIV